MTIPPEYTARIDAIERNDIDEAEDIMRGIVYAVGGCPTTVMHYLLMLQDDDAELRRRVAGLEVVVDAEVK